MTIDWWTLGLEAVNVAVLIWLLARFFWRPLAAMIEERRIAAAKDLTEAAAKRTEAEKALAEIATIRAGLAKEREAMLVAAAGEADKEHATRLAQAMTEIEALRAAARAAIVKQKDEARKDWHEHAAKLAVDIAGRLVEGLEGSLPVGPFLDGLIREIQRLPESQRRGLAFLLRQGGRGQQHRRRQAQHRARPQRVGDRHAQAARAFAVVVVATHGIPPWLTPGRMVPAVPRARYAANGALAEGGWIESGQVMQRMRMICISRPLAG